MNKKIVAKIAVSGIAFVLGIISGLITFGVIAVVAPYVWLFIQILVFCVISTVWWNVWESVIKAIIRKAKAQFSKNKEEK